MDATSTIRTRKRRNHVWTTQHQSIADVAAACGVSCGQIGWVVGVHGYTVSCHLDPRAKERQRARSQRRAAADPERNRERSREWDRLNKDRKREANHTRQTLLRGISRDH
jgi:hypothetical protein